MSLSPGFPEGAANTPAQVDYMLQTTDGVLNSCGYAEIGFAATNAFVGFHSSNGDPFARIHLEDGHLVSYVFRQLEDGIWYMLSTAGTALREADITGPFEVQDNNQFVYKGQKDLVWNACTQASDGRHKISLSTTPLKNDLTCFGNITIVATAIA